MRIVLVGGIPESLVRFRGELLARFVALGHDVLALAGHEDADTSAELARMGVRFATFPLGRTGTAVRQDLATLRALSRIFARERPDIVLAYTAKPVIWGGIAARRVGGIRFFALITGTGAQFAPAPSGERERLRDGEPGAMRALAARALPAVLRALYRRALSRAERVIFQNEDDRARFVDRGLVAAGVTARVHGSGVDLGLYDCRPTPPHPPVRFLMVARLLAAKGVEEYAEAARHVRLVRPHTRFVLIGPPERGAGAVPMTRIRALVANGAMEYEDALPDVRAPMAACHVYVLPSYYGEGVPRTLLEAMAVGRPVITTDNVGCRDAVEPGVTGLMVPPRDAQALATAMRTLVDDAALRDRFGRAGRARAERYYDVHRVNEALLGIMGLASAPAEEPALPPSLES